jgi:tryptophan 2,3-dioxygenase
MSETRAAAEEKIVWDMPKADSYGGYLDLPTLLSAQKPRSDDHDEMLFIVIHQASELWMKLALHELTAALHFIQRDMLDDSLKILSRIGRVQQQMIQSWDVLATMTPHDYQRLRPYLGSSSGFQSHQYRHMEFLLGNKDRKLAEVHRNDPAAYEVLKQVLEAPGLYDEVLMFLGRRGLALPAEVLARDFSAPYQPHDAVEEAWLTIYRDVEKYWDLYDLAEKLVDVDDRFQQWRFRHVRTVQRIIGMKSGTGGSSGVPYLNRALDLRMFPELWTLRTKL